MVLGISAVSPRCSPRMSTHIPASGTSARADDVGWMRRRVRRSGLRISGKVSSGSNGSSSATYLPRESSASFQSRMFVESSNAGSALRHIRLLNTPEQKPITNSRDTQELHYEAGCEVLQIFLEHQTKSKTSLLQDFAYYEVSHAIKRNRRISIREDELTRRQQLSAQRGQSPAPSSGMPHQVSTPPPIPQQYAMPMPVNMNMPMGGVPPVPPIPARFR